MDDTGGQQRAERVGELCCGKADANDGCCFAVRRKRSPLQCLPGALPEQNPEELPFIALLYSARHIGGSSLRIRYGVFALK